MSNYDECANNEADQNLQIISKSRPLEILEHIAQKQGKSLNEFMGFRTAEYQTSHSDKFNEE